MDPYAHMFDQYVVELRAAHAEALAWWERLIEKETARTGDRLRAENTLRLRWPMGATAYPRVIAVFRKYFLACTEINNEFWEATEDLDDDASPLDGSLWGVEDDVDDDESLIEQPRVVLFERLEDVDETLARFMDNMVFIPVGADGDGRLV